MAVTVQEAKELVIKFCRTYPVAAQLTYYIRSTVEELYGDRANGMDMVGAYITGPGLHPGRCDFPSNKAKNDSDFITTLRHEIIGHFGLNTFTGAEKSALLNSIVASRQEPSMRGLWAVVDTRYADSPDSIKAEEIFALFCEGVEPEQHINNAQVHENGLRTFYETCIDPSRLMQLEDVSSIAMMVAHGLHDRTRSQKNFPAVNQQFKKDQDMETKKSFHETVAENLIEKLKEGTAPWQKPWQGGDPGAVMPRNPITGKRYKGINAIHLMSQGYSDQRWMTYKQAIVVEAQVRKGERGTLIQYWKFSEERDKLDASGKAILDVSGKPVKQTVRLERPRVFFATVFNAGQIDGLPLIQPRTQQDWNAIERAEQILQSSGATILHSDQNRAFYRLSTDSIHLPERGQFASADAYYATALHELGHWTGHELRLNRDLEHPFGSDGYAKEELRAEIASMILGDELGLGHDPAQHVAYVGSWIKVLQENPLEIFRAAADAEKIQDYVLGLELTQLQETQLEQQATELEQAKDITRSQEWTSRLEMEIGIVKEKISELLLDNEEREYLVDNLFDHMNPEDISFGVDEALQQEFGEDTESDTEHQKRRTLLTRLLSNEYVLKGLIAHIEEGSIYIPTARDKINKLVSGNEERQRILRKIENEFFKGRYEEEIVSILAEKRTAEKFKNQDISDRYVLMEYESHRYSEKSNVKDELVLEQLTAFIEEGRTYIPTAQDRLDDLVPDADEWGRIWDKFYADGHREKALSLAKERLEEEYRNQDMRDPRVLKKYEAHRLFEYSNIRDEMVLEQLLSQRENDEQLHKQLPINHQPNHSPTKIFITVPFKQKDEVKTLGAKWDREQKSWYIPENSDIALFTKWTQATIDESAKVPVTQPPGETKYRQYLAVPYGEHVAAKAAGAKWDKTAKSWYAESKSDMTKLKRWVADQESGQQSPAMTPQEEFGEALRSLGCIVDGGHPIMDGATHRIAVDGDRKGEQAGFYVGHLDGHPAGYIKNNKTGIDMKWKSKGYSLAPELKAQMQTEAAAKLQAREVEQARLHEQAAQRMVRQMDDLIPVTNTTTYMQVKGIEAFAGVFTDNEGQKTYIPAIDTDGKQWSMQYIQEDGIKRFAKDSRKEGCFHAIGGLDALSNAPALIISEGYATASSLSKSLGFATVAAFDSGNLTHVARALHEKFPDKPIVIAGDDDKHLETTQGINPGRSKAEEAARAVGGRLLLPIFSPGEQTLNPKGFTDFNDLANNSVLGQEGIDRQVRPIVEAEILKHKMRHMDEQHLELAQQETLPRRKAASIG